MAVRMIRSKKRAATFTLAVTFLAFLCIPLDIMLAIKEKKYIAARKSKTNLPVIFICGPARSGTTLVYQVLAGYIDFAFFQNFTMLFPRSPIVSTRIFRRMYRSSHGKIAFDNYYGKTSGLSSPCEANHIWNRWVDPDKTGFRTRLSADAAVELNEFCLSFLALDNKPLICKNNNLNVFADTVAAAMPNSLFICLRREPRFLAQSLLNARRDIRGDISKGYGVQDTENVTEQDNPIRAVCSQIHYLDHMAEQMQQRIGPDRFWIVQYEEFCRNPWELINRVAENTNTSIKHVRVDDPSISSIAAHNSVRDPAEMEQIDNELETLSGIRRDKSNSVV